MTAIDLDMLAFRRRVAAASTVGQVVAVVRGMLFALPPEELERLPGGCSELSVHDAASLCRWSTLLAQAAAEHGAPPDSVLSRLATTLTDAAHRAVTLAARATEPFPDDPR